MRSRISLKLVRALGLKPAIAALMAFTVAGASAADGDVSNTLLFGFGAASLPTRSGELQGPPGTTPPGITASLDDTQTAVVLYKRRISGGWGAELLIGYPPTLDLTAGGSASALGKVASARAWFPSVLASYTWETGGGLRPYVAAGLHRTWFDRVEVSDTYTQTVAGVSTSGEVRSDIGPVVRLGLEYAPSEPWVVDVSFTQYWINTKATLATNMGGPSIERTIDLAIRPRIVMVMVGRRF